MKQELLPCPFCGGKAILKGETAKYIQCERCLASTSTSGFEEVAINAWNTRHEHTEHSLEMMQELTTEFDWEQRRYETANMLLLAILNRDFIQPENFKTRINEVIQTSNELINQLKQQSDE